MSESVSLPALGESVTEGTVTRWLKNVGDRVEVDELLLDPVPHGGQGAPRGGRVRAGPRHLVESLVQSPIGRAQIARSKAGPCSTVARAISHTPQFSTSSVTVRGG